MKTSATIAACLALSVILSASNFPLSTGSKCREFVPAMPGHLENTALAIYQDLLNGIWTQGDNLTYHFMENGQLLQFHADGSVESFFWWVETLGSLPLLVTHNATGHENKWLVEQTCEGVLLKDIFGKNNLPLDYQPLALGPKTISTKNLLVGEWTNVTAFETEQGVQTALGNYLNYRFHDNGTYLCSFGDQNKDQVHKGLWEISKDGKYLLFYTMSGRTETNKQGIFPMRLVHIDDHGLVLERVTANDPVNDFFASYNRTFTFIK